MLIYTRITHSRLCCNLYLADVHVGPTINLFTVRYMSHLLLVFYSKYVRIIHPIRVRRAYREIFKIQQIFKIQHRHLTSVRMSSQRRERRKLMLKLHGCENVRECAQTCELTRSLRPHQSAGNGTPLTIHYPHSASTKLQHSPCVPRRIPVRSTPMPPPQNNRRTEASCFRSSVRCLSVRTPIPRITRLVDGF